MSFTGKSNDLSRQRNPSKRRVQDQKLHGNSKVSNQAIKDSPEKKRVKGLFQNHKNKNSSSNPKGKKEQSDNTIFFISIETYITSSIEKYSGKISAEEKKYADKKWKIDKNTGKFKSYQNRIDQLKSIKTKFEKIKTTIEKKKNDLLTLANVVHNEAATSNKSAKLAVAYAYLNRVDYKEDGKVNEPEGTDISHYSELLDRWNSFSTEAEKLTFLSSFSGSFNAAQTRMEESNPTDKDPTKGATHWVSPKGLDLSKGSGNYYNEEFNKYFPNWARSQEWVKNNPEKAKDWFDTDEFMEVTSEGIPREDFIFYKGVK